MGVIHTRPMQYLVCVLYLSFVKKKLKLQEKLIKHAESALSVNGSPPAIRPFCQYSIDLLLLLDMIKLRWLVLANAGAERLRLSTASLSESKLF